MAAAVEPHVGAVGGERIDLVEEQDARPVASRLFEPLVQIALAAADPHVEDVANADGQERGADLASRSAGEMRFAAARWTVQQNSAPDLFPIRRVQLRMRERMNDFHPNLILDRLHAADVLEADSGPLKIALKRSRFIRIAEFGN